MVEGILPFGSGHAAGEPLAARARAASGHRVAAGVWGEQQGRAEEWGMTSTAPFVTVSPRDYDAVLFDLDGPPG